MNLSMPRFSLRQLLYFTVAAETGTVSGAAERLRVSQSAVSLALTDLEKALGVQLCVRRKAHGITLTPSGSQVLRRAHELLQQAEELREIASGAGESLSGVLTLGCYLTLAPTVLPALMQGFSARHPRLTIGFAEGTQDLLRERMLRGELDLAITYHMDLAPEMRLVRLFSLRPHVLLPADHPMAGQPTVSLRDLEPEPMVLLDAPPSAHHTLMLCRHAGVKPTVRHRATTFETARALVGRGMGYSLLVTRPPNDRTYEGLRVVTKEIAEPVEDASVVLAWPETVRLSRRAREFVRYCQTAEHPMRRSVPGAGGGS